MTDEIEHDKPDAITRLRAENERLGRDYQTARNAHDKLVLKNERLRAANRDVMLHWDVLKADYERLRAALTPSAETKAAYIGEFHFTEESYDEDGQVYYRKVAVPWTIIKEIMAAISARAALDGQPAPGKEEA